jgi:hypothetical protein
LGDLRVGNAPAAYGLLCSELKTGVSFATYSSEIEKESLTGGHLISFNAHGITSLLGSRYTLVRVDIHTTTLTATIVARMTKEGGHWRWCGSQPAAKTHSVNVPLTPIMP